MVASGDEGRGADAGRALACGAGRRVNWCAWLGRVRCACGRKEKGRGEAGRCGENRKGRMGTAGPPVGQRGKGRKGLG